MKKHKKIIIILASLAFLLLITINFIYFTKKSKDEEALKEDWSLNNQTELVKNIFKEYSKQDVSETKEERRERLQEYLTSDSPVLDYDISEVKNMEADSSTGEVIEMKECHLQEGDDLCLLINTRIEYYKENKKINTEVSSYWLTIEYIEGTGFRVYDMGIYDFGYNEDLI